jgi:hypothetical protein
LKQESEPGLLALKAKKKAVRDVNRRIDVMLQLPAPQAESQELPGDAKVQPEGDTVVEVVVPDNVVLTAAVVVLGDCTMQPEGLQQHNRLPVYVALQAVIVVAPKQALSRNVRIPGWLGDDPEA